MSDKQDDEHLYDDLEDSFEDDGSYDAEYSVDLEQFDEFDNLDSMPDDNIEEPWDDNLSAPAFDETLLKKEKRRLNLSFNTIMITGAVIVGGIFLVYNVVSSKPSGTVGQRFVSALQFTGATDDVIYGEEQGVKQEDPSQILPNESASNVVEQSEGTDKGFLFEPDVLDSMEMNLDQTVSTSTPSATTIKTSAPQENNVTKNLDDSENIEFLDILQPPSQVTAPPLSEATNIPRAPEIQAVKNTVEPLTPPAQEKIEEIVEPEEYVVVKRTQTEPPVAPVAPIDSAADKIIGTSSLESKLDLIVTRLDKMEGQIEGIKNSNNDKIDEISATLVELDQKVNKVQAAPAKQAPITKAIASAPKKVIKKLPTVSAAPKTSWELRAAQPGKAWVSRAGQKEMQAVMVGDNLEGVGRINAISFNNGRWLVQGSSGQIRQ